ncbi:MAG: TolC family protein, partial [Alistipes sp.]|nr:TolC family protein [Alistipes sp.]
MKTVVRIALLATLLSGATVVSAQRRSLSLEEALSATLADNPAMKAAAFEEKAAREERRAAIGLRMPRIGLTGAYAYMAKDIGFDFNDLKGPANQMAGQLLGSGLVPPSQIPAIQGLLAPIMGADWFLKVQDRSLGFVGGEVTLPIWMGGKINAANRAARINELAAAEAGHQTRNALVSELVERYFGLALARQVVAVRQQVVDGVRKHLE